MPGTAGIAAPVVDSSRHPVESRLREQVAAQRLEFDAAQADAAQRLDRLGAALTGASASFGETLRAHLPWLAPRTRAPLRGLYLWGGVGRGKTLLMDWFYESLRLPKRERTHFYRFMRRVHAELRAAARREAPLDAVAQRLAQSARLICLDEFFVADIADAMILGGLFEGLFRRGVTLVATSNVPPHELYKDGLQRQRFLPAIELLQSHVDVVALGRWRRSPLAAPGTGTHLPRFGPGGHGGAIAAQVCGARRRLRRGALDPRRGRPRHRRGRHGIADGLVRIQ